MNSELKAELNRQGADIVRFVEISQLSGKENRGYPRAILIGKTLSQFTREEFQETEKKTDRMADQLSEYLSSRGYGSFSQSEQQLYLSKQYDEKSKVSPLPHKTIAGLAGLGWIGKHDLMISPEFGSAFSMCSVLTDAPLETELHTPAGSLCGECRLCADLCLMKAIKGNEWHRGVSRENLVDVFKCNFCYECVLQCPWTQKYAAKQNKTQI